MEQDQYPTYVSFKGLPPIWKLPESFRVDYYGNVIHRESYNLRSPLGWVWDDQRNIIAHWRTIEKPDQCGISVARLLEFLSEKYVYGVHVNEFFKFDILAAIDPMPPNSLTLMQRLMNVRDHFENWHLYPEVEQMALELPPTVAIDAIDISLAKKSIKYLKTVLENKFKTLRTSPFKAPIREASPVKLTCYPEARPLKTQTVEKTEKSAFSKFIVKIKKVKISDYSEKYMDDVVVSNRIIRHVGDPSRFLLVSFDRSKYDAWRTNEDWKKKIKNIFLNGLRVENKVFKFLGFSSSGIREAQAFFFNEGSDFTVLSLRKDMGDFSDALKQGISKYIARFGQTFSKSVETVEVDPNVVIEKYPDFKENEYVFSDGCGMICESLARKVTEVLVECFPTLMGSSNQLMVPSVFQIRYKGNKGVVAVHPDSFLPYMPNSNNRAQLVLRKSMWKFDSPPTKIEILNFSSPSETASLNKHIVYILKEQKIANEVFIRLAEEYLSNIKTILSNEVAAVNFLSRQEAPAMKRLASLVMAEHGLNEPFLRTSLISLLSKKISALEKNVKIPIKKARYFIGVIDESGTLAENEVYVNIKQLPLMQRVIVTRNPCRHPGDLRVLEAVNRPDLSHLRDCIVFSRQGQRPQMDMMSGGDLDGDMFFVCWEESLIPSMDDVVPPTEYPKPKPEPEIIFPDQIDAKMVEFFLQYTATNELGLISFAHDIACELFGSMHAISVELAMDASRAVDAAKTGELVQLNKEYKDLYTQKPVWMGGNNMAHTDVSVVGKIALLAKSFNLQLSQEKPRQQGMEVDPDLVYKNDTTQWQESYQEALVLLFGFNLKLKDIIATQTEETKPKAVMKAKLGNSLMKSQADEQLREEYESIFKYGCKTLEDSLIKASAWYCAAYTKQTKAFAWIGIDYLNRLKADAIATRNNESISLSVGKRWLQYLKGKSEHVQ